MASEQVEYCGDCKHYKRCKTLANKGRLNHCLAQKEGKKQT